MKNLGKFTFYTPDNPATHNANHLQNEKGTDWYTISWDRERIAGNIYAGTDDNSKVICVSDNGAMLFPAGMTVWEIPKDEAPDSILTEGYGATIIDGVYAIDYPLQAERQRQSLLSGANSTISLWQTETALGSISSEDKASLIKWIAYIKALKVLDFSGITDEATYKSMEWPEPPQ